MSTGPCVHAALRRRSRARRTSRAPAARAARGSRRDRRRAGARPARSEKAPMPPRRHRDRSAGARRRCRPCRCPRLRASASHARRSVRPAPAARTARPPPARDHPDRRPRCRRADRGRTGCASRGWPAGGACTRTSESRARRSAGPAPGPRSPSAVPCVSSSVRYASTAPGTVKERCASAPGPVGMRSSPRLRKSSTVASAGAVPWPLSACVSPRRAS